MINIKFINATSVQLVDKNNNVVTTIGEFSGSPIVYTYNGNTFSKNDLEYYHFAITGTNVQLSGVIDSVTTKQQFTNLFKGCTNITDSSQLELTASDLTESCYAGMFLNCSNLKTPPVLAATGLAMWCYNSMFAGCSSLSSAPTLPATTLAPYCYYAMFYGCSNLSTSPYLPAATLTSWCYNSMFYNCLNLDLISCNFGSWSGNATSSWVTNVAASGKFKNNNVNLVYGNNNIPEGWKDIKDNMYLTFSNNTVAHSWYATLSSSDPNKKFKWRHAFNSYGLWQDYLLGTTLDAFDWGAAGVGAIQFSGDATQDGQLHFNIFSNGATVNVRGSIASLIDFSDSLPSTSIFGSLFSNCNAIRHTSGLILPYTNLNSHCYDSMFQYCTGLITPPALPATNLADNCYLNMFQGCTNLSTTPQLPATTLANRCYCQMFHHCDSLLNTPLLPATTLAPSCYWGMFLNCWGLTGVLTTLPATELVDSCYKQMFYGCSSLLLIDVNFTDWSTNLNATQDWVYRVAANGTFVKPSILTELYGTSYIPLHWTINNSD